MRKVLLSLVLVLICSSMVFAANLDPMLVEVMNNDQGLIPVVVQMTPGAKHVDVAQMGGKLGYTYTIINGFSAELPVAAIKALAKNPQVYSISYDKELEAQLNTASCTVRSTDLWYKDGITGKGITIAVIDTGIFQHVDFQSRIIGFKDFVNNRTVPYDDNGHGTYCAGVAAGNGSTYIGPAKNAYLVGVKVLNKYGSGSLSTIINGINWCVQNAGVYGIDILSISIGGTITQSSTTDPMCAAVRNAWNAGLVVVCSAGSGDITTPGNEPLIITVSASDDHGTCDISDDTIPSFAPQGPTPIDGWLKPDMVAPGVNVTAANYTGGYSTMSGSSGAAALVAGVCAQILEYRYRSPQAVKTALMNTARDLGYSPYIQGAGLIDAYAATHY